MTLLKDKKAFIKLIIGIALMIVLILSAAYAYYSITTSNNTITSNITASAQTIGTPALNSSTQTLYMYISLDMMSKENQGKIFYATTNSNGVGIEDSQATLNNGIFTIATASVATGTATFDCSYNYDVSATLTNTVSDGSTANVKVTFKGDSLTGGEKTYTLADLLSGTKTLTGVFHNLSAGHQQTITVQSTVDNTTSVQNGLSSNMYSINITPKTGASGFSCIIS